MNENTTRSPEVEKPMNLILYLNFQREIIQTEFIYSTKQMICNSYYIIILFEFLSHTSLVLLAVEANIRNSPWAFLPWAQVPIATVDYYYNHSRSIFPLLLVPGASEVSTIFEHVFIGWCFAEAAVLEKRGISLLVGLELITVSTGPRS